jgi:hypothetical protein
MPYYKDAAGAVHYFSSIAYINELPAGSQVVTDEEAFALLPTPLNTAITDKIAEVDAACDAAVQGGFVSSALGSAYTYPSKASDQANLSSSVLASLLPNLPANWTTLFWCYDAKGQGNLVAHTAAQIQQVGTDGKNWIGKCIYAKVILENKIAACQDPADVAQYSWVNPT